MSDLISRKAAIDVIGEYDFEFPNYMERFVTELRDAMKADLENDIEALPPAQPEIITCIDCIHYAPFRKDKAWGSCPVNQRMCQSCDFCAWAERREEDG